jgi:hypothetical protein
MEAMASRSLKMRTDEDAVEAASAVKASIDGFGEHSGRHSGDE